MINKIYIQSRGKINFINEDDIAMLHADGSYCIIKLINGTEFRVSKNMNSVYNQINQKENFEIVHRSYCVNTRLICNVFYDKERNCNWSILLSTGDVVHASLNFVHNFKKAIKSKNSLKNNK